MPPRPCVGCARAVLPALPRGHPGRLGDRDVQALATAAGHGRPHPAHSGGPWTEATLAAIAARPATRAADLAADLGRERLEFKRDVRKLKALGLTLSLEVGYRLSPRGQAYWRERNAR